MLVIPAIDLKDGQCVRLLQGRKEDATVYSNDPAAVAKKWESYGARLLHIVDLDGAFTGSQKNIDSIRQIRAAVKMDLEVGGGIRNIDRIDILMDLGINRVIMGTVAIENPEIVKKASVKYPGSILVGVDAINGLVAVKGWVEITKVKAGDLSLTMQDYGAAGIIYTDISKDGMMLGPNIEATREIVDSLDIPVIASGGISSIADIDKLLGIKKLWGAITGKALYAGSLDLAEAIKLAQAGF